jgi:CO/xanthine dehydrogenase Mo-binding subunit
VRVRGVFTNTVPVDAYRGAGRPEAAYVIERLVDVAARDRDALGADMVASALSAAHGEGNAVTTQPVDQPPEAVGG